MTFTWLRTSTTTLKRRVEHAEDLAADAVRRLVELERRLEDLELAHNRLRGRYYKQQHLDREEEAPSREARRAQAFQKAGFVPGKPVDFRNKEAK